jgi:GDSL-like lipase/acylhydrolase family protein
MKLVWLLAGLLAVALPGAALGGVPLPGRPTVDPGPAKVKLENPPVARPNVALARRADAAWSAWNPATGLYSPTYVSPSDWLLGLDGCASSAGLGSPGIAYYGWKLTPLANQGYEFTHLATRCQSAVRIPRLGRWRVELTVLTKSKLHDTASREFTLRDIVVASIGDSYSSGEGNPDKNNDSPFPPGNEEWKDAQCHRSASGWPFRAALELESRTTSVTFLSFACSGAEVRDLIFTGYTGIEEGRELRGQLTALRDTLGLPGRSPTRAVDALLISAGVNNMHFSDLLTSCAESVGNDCTEGSVAYSVNGGLLGLPLRYQELDSRIRHTVRAPSVFVAEYPSRVFTNGDDRHGGCGIFEAGMNSDEAHWISDRGDGLNAAIGAAADLYGWTYIGGVRDAFRGHGYCADDDDTWFRSWSGSQKLQADENGTAHPNRDGHRAVAALAAPVIQTELERRFLLQRGEEAPCCVQPVER